MRKKAFIQTYGCQMNEHDSQRMAEVLERSGYKIVDQLEQAELILLNSCSVRENPENKVFSQLGRIRELKQHNPKLVVGVGGCVAQQEGKNILQREPSVNLVFGTDQYMQLPKMLDEVNAGKKVLNLAWMPRQKRVQNFIPEMNLDTGYIQGCKAYIAITKGCDNFCSFCIVPLTRGREVSRNLGNVLFEAQSLLHRGAKEIMLLGQNVNSYSAKPHGFYDLLEQVSNLAGLMRLRFISPHPKDWNDDLSRLMASTPTICNQLHLPFQAGANRVVELMRRGHTTKQYLKKIHYLQSLIPDVGVSTDVIVGFPTESEEDFQQTLRVVEEVGFHQIYAFKYSQRPKTRAALLEDDVPQSIKEERLARLLELQHKIQNKILQSYLHRKMKILVESPHPKWSDTVRGRTDSNVSVALKSSTAQIGDLITAKITGLRQFSLLAEPTKSPSLPA